MTVRDDVLRNWDQIRAQLKEDLGLGDDELDRVNGDYDALVDVLGRRFGWTEGELDERLSVIATEAQRRDEPELPATLGRLREVDPGSREP